MNPKTLQKEKNSALRLSENNIPSSLRNHKPVTKYDLDLLVFILGAEFLKLTNEAMGQIYADKQCRNISIKKDGTTSKDGRNYTRSDYIVIVGNRVIMITTYIKKVGIFLPFYPNKSVQIDFMFSTDFYKNTNKYVAYGKTHKVRYVTKDKIDVSGLSFLRLLKKIILATPRSTKVKVFYLDKQRGHIYKKALKNLKNVKVIKVKK